MFLLNIEEMERSDNTSEDNTLQATSSRFSLFHLFVWPTLFLLNVSTALKGTHNYIFIYNATTQNKRKIDRAIK